MTNEEKQALIERINIAIKEFTSGRASMHVPPLDTDVDIVLADCEKMITALVAMTAQPVKCPSFDDYKPHVAEELRAAFIAAIRATGYEVQE